jgi:hypothetical protein
MSLRIAALVRPAAARSEAGPNAVEEFHDFHGKPALSTADRLIRVALRVLFEAWPRSVPFATLWARVEENLASSAGPAVSGAHPSVAASDPPHLASPERLAEALLDAFAHKIVDLHVHEPGFTTEISEFPRASPVARRQAATQPRVPNLRHRLVGLIDFDQFVLPYLDGRHDRRVLVAEMQDAIEKGVFTLQVQGRPITDPLEAAPLLERLLDESLRRLAAGVLLLD